EESTGCRQSVGPYHIFQTLRQPPRIYRTRCSLSVEGQILSLDLVRDRLTELIPSRSGHSGADAVEAFNNRLKAIGEAVAIGIRGDMRIRSQKHRWHIRAAAT